MLKSLKNVNILSVSLASKPGLASGFLETSTGSICQFDETSTTKKVEETIVLIQSEMDSLNSLIELGELVTKLGTNLNIQPPKDDAVEARLQTLYKQRAELEEIAVDFYRLLDLAKMWDSEQGKPTPTPTVTIGAGLPFPSSGKIRDSYNHARKASQEEVANAVAQIKDQVVIGVNAAQTSDPFTPPPGYKLDPNCFCGQCFIEIGGPEDVQASEGSAQPFQGLPSALLQLLQLSANGINSAAQPENDEAASSGSLPPNVRRLH